ncbi:glycosyltransferase [Demequina pelophila]|uniref:glycosyltransferase n=1 Tax=Demequina pelophila TaxID=1638984 RepID=UPI0007807F1C|nr:glycosyltransferase [Demequina pelophila]
MSAARLLVRAIVVADGRSSHLPATLAAVAAQDPRPDVVHVVLADGVDRPVVPDGFPVDWIEGLGRDLSASIDAVLAAHPALPQEYLWLLHDDSAPLEGALARLVATARKRTAAGVIGAAQVQWDDPSRLVSIGTTTTRVGARRIDLVDQDDINQGQYDDRDDVLGASLAGALVRRDVWEELGGLEPAYRGFGDSLHLCRRAWRAGHDVVVVPRARIRHAQDGLRGLRAGSARGERATYGSRRAGEWFHSLAWSPLGWTPLLLVWLVASALGRVILRIAQNEPRTALADLAVPWRVLARLRFLPGVRARIRHGSRRGRTIVRPLLVGPRAAASFVRSREMRSHERWRALHAPSDVVREELDAAATRRRVGAGLVTLGALGASVVLHGTWLTALLSGRMLVGDALGTTDLDLPSLWERTWSGWAAAGLGAPALDGAFAALLLPVAVLPGGVRFWIGMLLALGVALGVMAAWFASGAATRSVAVRACVAFAYGLWPMHLQAISDGRVGAVLAHVMLPWFALGLARAAGWHRGETVGEGESFPARQQASPSAAMGAAFSLAVIAVAAPVMLAPLVVIVLIAGVFAGRHRWRVWSAAVPGLVVSGPALVAAWTTGSVESAWAILARENGPALASAIAEPWRLLLGVGAEPRPVPGLDVPATVTVAGVGAIAVLAALAAVASGRASRAVSAGLATAALGVAVAVAAERTVVVGVHEPGAAANGFAGPGTSLALAGLLTAAAAASAGGWWWSHGRRRSAVRLTAAVSLTLAAGVLASTVVLEAWPSRAERGDVHPADSTVLPLVAALEQQVATRQRVLVLEDAADEGVTYSVLEWDGTQVLHGRAGLDADGSPFARPDATPATVDTLADAVAQLTGAGAGAQEDLAAWGVGVIVAAPDSPRIAGSLGQIPGLRLIGASDLGTTFRVTRADGSTPVSRAWIESGSRLVTLDSDSRSGRAEGALPAGTLVVAVPADPAWSAWADGVALEPVDDALGRAAFAVPDGASEVVYEYRDDTYAGWWWAGAAVMGWAIVGMIPLHDRRYRVVRA